MSVVWPSILFLHGERSPTERPGSEPGCFSDLNIDQMVAAIVGRREEYRLAEYFYAPLWNVDEVLYRQEVLRDFRASGPCDCIQSFAGHMRIMRTKLAQADTLRHPLQKMFWFLDAAEIYVRAVTDLVRGLHDTDPLSRGLLRVRDHITAYSASDAFSTLAADVRRVNGLLGDITYCVHILGPKVTVTRYDDEADYSHQVTTTFEKFKKGAVKSYHADLSHWPELNQVEERVLERVAQLFPDAFRALHRFSREHRDYLDGSIALFDREAQFYLAFQDYVSPLEKIGLPLCFPEVSSQSKEIHGWDTFDVVLARKLAAEDQMVVCNDFSLTDPERIFVVSGPNQGGKTTFARTFGQVHVLACLGLMVPGTDAKIFLYDQLFTHFERGENLHDLRGKLQDDLVRVHDILGAATERSIVIVNEIFSSTAVDDAIFLGTKVFDELIRLDLLCVCVTFIDEFSKIGNTAVSVASSVAPDDPARRTYKIERRPPDGLAHANAIAEKYQVTFEALRRRLGL